MRTLSQSSNMQIMKKMAILLRSTIDNAINENIERDAHVIS